MLLLKAYGLAIWEWLLQEHSWICHITCAPAKALQKLSPSRKTTFTFRRWCFLCFTQKLVKSIGFFWTKSGSFFSSLSGQISQFVFFSLFFFSSNFLFKLSSSFYTFAGFSVSNIKSLRKEKKMNGILEMESLELVINVRTFLLLK